MGSGFSHLIPCFKPEHAAATAANDPEVLFTAEQPLDETLGHSFCYVRSSARFLSPTPSDRFVSPSQSLRFSPSHERSDPKPPKSGLPPHETGFHTISGASVSANTATPRTVLQLDGIYDDATDIPSTGGCGSIVNGFESTSLFSALPLQPVPRGEQSGPIERGGLFLSGPIERGALSGPLDASTAGGEAGGVPFSAPLGPGGGLYPKSSRRRKKSFSGIRKAFHRSLSEKKRPWVVPVRNFAGRKEVSDVGSRDTGVGEGGGGAAASMVDNDSERNVQWALGKAGEDRVHVVVSEENGWLFVGIYDGFNGPDAPEFLMSHLYRAVYNELKGLFWESEDSCSSSSSKPQTVDGQTSVNIESCSVTAAVEELNPSVNSEICDDGKVHGESNGENCVPPVESDGGSVKKVTFQSEKRESRRKLWEFLAEDEAEDGLDLSGSERFAFSVDDAVSVSNADTAVGRRSLLLSKLKQGLSRNKDAQAKGLFPWRFGAEDKDKNDAVNRIEERVPKGCRRRKEGPVDHDLVLRALSLALEKTELAYLDLTEKVIDQYPELALMGSCLLVALMRDEDVYVMNLGDSRAIVAQLEALENAINLASNGKGDNRPGTEGIVEECVGDISNALARAASGQSTKLTALQLSTDHSTSIEEEVLRIKRDHPEDGQCIVNDRVKGRLKVTRAFGAGFLKQAKFNDSLLEMFRNEFIGSAAYVSCTPSLCHYRLGPRDQFLILSSDGLYQYLSNEEVVSHVASFMENNQDGDPAQHLIEELLSRAAKKAGMDFHDLLDIPQGDRRKYHDDVTVMVVSLEGRIWKSSGKYP